MAFAARDASVLDNVRWKPTFIARRAGPSSLRAATVYGRLGRGQGREVQWDPDALRWDGFIILGAILLGCGWVVADVAGIG